MCKRQTILLRCSLTLDNYTERIDVIDISRDILQVQPDNKEKNNSKMRSRKVNTMAEIINRLFKR